jgi:alpha-ketoglutarate-dependent taurine dioxygenase
MNVKSIAEFDAELKRVFGSNTSTAPLVDDTRMGRRIFAVDLTQPLNPEQSRLMVDLLDRFSVISFPGQDQSSFRLAYLERLANHFGAPIPHP